MTNTTSAYSKRALTGNMFLHVVGNDLALARDYAQIEELARPLAMGEMGSQAGACPLLANSELDHVGKLTQTYYRGLGIRKSQITAVLSVGDVTGLGADVAENLARAGSIALIATSYDQKSIDALVAAGVLPLLSDEPIDVGTWLFVRGIRNDVVISATQLMCYRVTDTHEPFALGLANLYAGQTHPYTRDHLRAIIGE